MESGSGNSIRNDFFLEDEGGDDDDDDDDDEEEEEEYCRAAQRQVLRLVRCSWTPCPGNTNTHPSSTAAKNISSNLLNVPRPFGGLDKFIMASSENHNNKKRRFGDHPKSNCMNLHSHGRVIF